MLAADMTCDTTLTPWTATVTADTDVRLRPGSASLGVRATAFDRGSGVFSGVESGGFLQLT